MRNPVYAVALEIAAKLRSLALSSAKGRRRLTVPRQAKQLLKRDVCVFSILLQCTEPKDRGAKGSWQNSENLLAFGFYVFNY